MKQIKTVIQPVENFMSFDIKVNELLLAGWQLTNRKMISIKGEPNEVGSAAIIQMLYAEFEKEVCHFEEITL